ncbi:MAG: hypothetical protein M0R51_05905 [Clostridia bacterium]|nr:hypothetical protein [Clostridia bacterium]
MKQVQVNKNYPETLRECESMMHANNCEACSIGGCAWKCSHNDKLYSDALSAGLIEEVRDSNGGTGYRWL